MTVAKQDGVDALTTGYQPANDEERKFLADYDPSKFDNPAVTVDVVLLTIRNGVLSVLLVERGDYPYKGCWALPGGFVDPDEKLLAAAARELGEETSLDDFHGHLEQLGSYGDPGRDPRMRVVSVAYLAMLPDVDTPQAGTDAADARFWPVEDLLDGEGPALAFDHDKILLDGVERARAKLEYTPLATAFVEEPFTIADLRRVYEAVWGEKQHPANFRRKVLSTEGFVVALGKKSETGGERGGPRAELYSRGTTTLLHPAMLRRTTLENATAAHQGDVVT